MVHKICLQQKVNDSTFIEQYQMKSKHYICLKHGFISSGHIQHWPDIIEGQILYSVQPIENHSLSKFLCHCDFSMSSWVALTCL